MFSPHLHTFACKVYTFQKQINSHLETPVLFWFCNSGSLPLGMTRCAVLYCQLFLRWFYFYLLGLTFVSQIHQPAFSTNCEPQYPRLIKCLERMFYIQIHDLYLLVKKVVERIFLSRIFSHCASLGGLPHYVVNDKQTTLGVVT